MNEQQLTNINVLSQDLLPTPEEVKAWGDPVVEQFIHGRAEGPMLT